MVLKQTSIQEKVLKQLKTQFAPNADQFQVS